MATNPPIAPPPQNGQFPSTAEMIKSLQKIAGLKTSQPSVVIGQVAQTPMSHTANAGGIYAPQASQILGLNHNSNMPLGGMSANNIKDVNTPWRLRLPFPSHVFHQGVPLHTGMIVYNVDNMHFMFQVWMRVTDIDPSQYGFMLTSEYMDPKTYQTEPGRITILFTDEKKCEEFEQWMTAYMARFNGDFYDAYVPTITAGARVSGSAIPMTTSRQMSWGGDVTIEFLDDWVWIVANTHDPVLCSNGFWLFQNESEMVMFKLRGEK